MNLNHYRFHTRWELEHDAADVYRALESFEDYPSWWPEVRSVRKVDTARFEVVVRSLLPYIIRFRSTAEDQDPSSGRLGIRMEGDLEGYSRWSISTNGRGCRLEFDEDVVANKLLLRWLALIARPFFTANHALMMRSCRRGLEAYLAGMRRGSSDQATNL